MPCSHLLKITFYTFDKKVGCGVYSKIHFFGIIYFRRVRYPLRFARPPNLGGQYVGAYCPSVLPTPQTPSCEGVCLFAPFKPYVFLP